MSASQPPYDFKRFVNERMNLGKEQLNNILARVESILQEEDKLVKIPKGKVFVMGDTHGNIDLTFHAIKHLLQFREIENEGGQHTIFDKLIFLGDFIDRGPYSVKNVNLLMS